MKVEFDGKTFVVEYNENGAVDVFFQCQDKVCKLIVSNETYLRFGPLNYVSENDFIPGLVKILRDTFYSIEESKNRCRYELVETEKEIIVSDIRDNVTYSFYCGIDCCWNMYKDNTWCGSFQVKDDVMDYIRTHYNGYRTLNVL